jgi:hypothetical protein
MGPRDEMWQKLRAVLTRSRDPAAGAGSRARRRGRELRRRLVPRTRALAVAAGERITVGGAGRWVRAVGGELVNLDGCDYVAVEEERGESYAVIARMHGGAANWVLARYGSRGEATRAQDWLAGHLEAWRLDLVAVEPGGEGDVGPATE